MRCDAARGRARDALRDRISIVSRHHVGLGADVRVTPRSDGYQVSLAFGSLDEALEVAERLGVTAAA